MRRRVLYDGRLLKRQMLKRLVLGDGGARFYEKNLYLFLMLYVIFSIWGCSPSKSSKESSNQQSLNNEVKSDVKKIIRLEKNHFGFDRDCSEVCRIQ